MEAYQLLEKLQEKLNEGHEIEDQLTGIFNERLVIQVDGDEYVFRNGMMHSNGKEHDIDPEDITGFRVKEKGDPDKVTFYKSRYEDTLTRAQELEKEVEILKKEYQKLERKSEQKPEQKSEKKSNKISRKTNDQSPFPGA